MASANDLIVVTGATGKQGGSLAARLYGRCRLRLIVRSEKSLKTLKAKYSDAEVVQADTSLPQECEKIVEGATTLFAMGPPFHPHEKEIGMYLIDAAIKEKDKPNSSFRHFILASVLNTQLRKLTNHDDKRYIEEYLIESGLNSTILQPGDFVEQTFWIKDWAISDDPQYLCMFNPEAVSSVVFLDDLAEATAKVVLERERHYGAQYPLVSKGLVSWGTLVEEASEAMAKKIGLERLSWEQSSAIAMTATYGSPENAPTRTRDTTDRFAVYYSRRGLVGNSNVLEWLLGRKATTMAEYVKKKLAE